MWWRTDAHVHTEENMSGTATTYWTYLTFKTVSKILGRAMATVKDCISNEFMFKMLTPERRLLTATHFMATGATTNKACLILLIRTRIYLTWCSQWGGSLGGVHQIIPITNAIDSGMSDSVYNILMNTGMVNSCLVISKCWLIVSLNWAHVLRLYVTVMLHQPAFHEFPSAPWTHISHHKYGRCAAFCMYDPMSPHFSSLWEKFTAYITRVWPFSWMDHHVGFQLTACGEPFVTQTAFIRLLPCVNSFMNDEVLALTESFFTDVTLIRFLSRMDPHMHVEMIDALKCFATFLTHKLFYALVGFFMPPEMATVGENLTANVTK